MMNMGQIRTLLKVKKLRVTIELTEGHYLRMPLPRNLFLRLTINIPDDTEVNAHVRSDGIMINQMPKEVKKEEIFPANESFTFFDSQGAKI
jgi:hypothetical protein